MQPKSLRRNQPITRYEVLYDRFLLNQFNCTEMQSSGYVRSVLVGKAGGEMNIVPAVYVPLT